jgi:hypothetical protein
VVLIAVLAVLGLVAGVTIWALWVTRAPATPTDLSASQTATSVRLTWLPGDGDVEVDHFVIVRNGVEVGTVAGTETAYVDDAGLTPGAEYDYQLIARSGDTQSEPSEHLAVRTLAPSPVDLVLDTSTASTVSFHWSPPPDSPAPDQYVVIRDGVALDPIPGDATSYTENGLSAETPLEFQVVAAWGENRSEPSASLTVTTLTWDAPLQGTWPVELRTTKVPGSGASGEVGDTWSDTWTFTPKCVGSKCDVTLKGSVGGPGYKDVPFTVTLKRSGNVYTGSTKAKVTVCRTVRSLDTLTLRLTGTSDPVTGLWSAWKGTFVLGSPYTNAGDGYYCPAQSWTFALTGAQ